MKIISEITLNQFAFWGGAKSYAEMLTYEEMEIVSDMLEDIYCDGVEDTAINDLFWFDFGIVAEWLGYTYDVDKDVLIREREREEE